MENEQLQHLIVAIEGLIELTGANGKIAESRVMQELERAKISDTQTEAILTLLQQIKQKCSDEDSRKEFHTENLQAFQDLADNLKEELKEGNTNIASAFEKMTTQLEAAINSLKEKDTPLESVEIKNLADIKFPEVQKVEIVKMPEEKKEPAEPVEVKEPKWYQAFNYDKILSGIKKIFESLTLKVSFDKTPGINILDEKGKIISDFSPIVRAGGGGSDNTYLKNKDGQAINPATEDKQEAIIDNQNLAITEMAEDQMLLRQLLQLLKPLGIIGSGSGRIILDIGAGTITTVTTVGTVNTVTAVTTVGTVSNQANIGGLNALDLQFNQAHTNWNTGIRNNITF